MPTANAIRWGATAAVVTFLAFLALSWGLGVRTGRPIATRTDLFFQSDAGGLVADAATDFTGRGRGVHPILYFVWTKPLHALGRVLEPSVPMEVTATVGSRTIVAGWAGVGMGVLVAGLLRRGIPGRVILAVAPLYLVGSGQAMAAMPDHFGISQGILAASFGVYIAPGRFAIRFGALGLLTLLAGGITVTNVVFPGGLAAMLLFQHYQSRMCWWWYAAAGAAVVGGVVLGTVVLLSVDGLRERFLMRVEGYLTWRLTEDPVEALKFAFRGLVDSVVAPTPAVTRDNLDAVPMLTYQPSGRPYSVWPYDLWQSPGAAAWLTLLGLGTWKALRRAEFRGPTTLLVVWVLWNAVFHNVWGDEYFLYTPHYSWALLAVVLLGRPFASGKWLWPLSVTAALAAGYTLWQFQQLIGAIES